MALTGGYDYAVELDIEVVREIFHLAFKQEDRFPHNYGPIDRSFTAPGGSPLHAEIRVRVYDEDARPADLRFTAVDVMTFTFPIDIDIQIAEAPAPELSHLLIAAVIEVPGLLRQLPVSEEDGTKALGLDFSAVTASDVVIAQRDPLPAVDGGLLTSALHRAYETSRIPHSTTDSGFTLLVYDGNRDTGLSPPNTSGAEIAAALVAGDWVRITLPVHVEGSESGYTLSSYGSITFFRRLERAAETIVLHVGAVPPAADAAHATTCTLTDVPAVSTSVFETALHQAYLAGVIPHTTVLGGQTLILYDGGADTTLDPAHPTSAAITAALETAGAQTFLHVRIPCHVAAGGFESFGVLHFYREVVTTPTTVSVDFAAVPVAADRQTHFALDAAYLEPAANASAPLVDADLAAMGTKSGPNPTGAAAQAVAQRFDAASVAIGDVVQVAPSDARFDELLRDGVVDYLSTRKFPVYTPDPGQNDVTLSDPVGKLLVADGVLAIQMNPTAGEADDIPDDFLGSDRLALAVGGAELRRRIQQHIDETFPELATGGRSKIKEITNRNVWLTKLSVTPGDGQFDVSGEAVVEVCCWKDPTIEFSGPVTLQVDHDDQGCLSAVHGVAGDFDIDQSSCDIVLEVFVPVVGWIVGIVIATTIDSVGGGIAEDIAGEQGEVISAIPPVIFGIAQVTSCLTDVKIRPDGLVMPGKIGVERVDRSFDDLANDRREPDGGG